jgi:chromate transport protein ChrA
VTFGGAYTVIPYLHDAAVDGQHWLTDGQFVDGLAIGLIAAVTVEILDTSVVDVPTALLAMAAFLALIRWHAKATVVAVVVACGVAGVLLQVTGAV